MIIRIAITHDIVAEFSEEFLLRTLNNHWPEFRCNHCSQYNHALALRGHLVDDVIVPRCAEHKERGSDRLDSVLRTWMKGLRREEVQARHVAHEHEERRTADIRRSVRRSMAA